MARPCDLKLLTLLAALIVASGAGCAHRKFTDSGLADVPQCRQAANSVRATEFDTRLNVLQLRADAYASCMEEHGYVLDENELDRRLLYKEQVKNGDPLGGDPAPFLAAYRQELRMNPALWRAASR